MNTNIFKIIKSASVILLLIFVYACSPIEDRDKLSNSFSPDNIALEVIQSTPGSNKVTLKMNSMGVAGYWDYILDQQFTNEIKDIIFPFTGKHTLTYHVTTPYISSGGIANPEYIKKTIQVNITQLDTPLPDAYYALVGEELGGKTWVFDGESGDDRVWWAMADPENYNAIWWNAGGTGTVPSDVNGHMSFDVTGNLNFIAYASPDGSPQKGTYSFNKDFTKLYIKGDTNILGSSHDNSGNNKEFQIIKLTNEQLGLFVPNASGGTGWVWYFKPQNQ